jgi:hypothetical protein
MTTSTAPSLAEVTAWAQKLYSEGVDKRDAKKFADAFVEGGTCRFGNNPELVGRDAIEEAITGFFTVMAGVQHSSAGTHYAGRTLVLEANVTYTLHQGGTVSVPACTIFTMAEVSPPKAESCRIYVDLAPLFSAAATG